MNKKDESFKDFVLDQLQERDGVEARCMFGGYGLYEDESFFGIFHNGRWYFRTDETTVGEYRKRKMKPFRPNAKQTLKNYYQVPAEIIEDAEQLSEWAKRAIRCQRKIKVDPEESDMSGLWSGVVCAPRSAMNVPPSRCLPGIAIVATARNPVAAPMCRRSPCRLIL